MRQVVEHHVSQPTADNDAHRDVHQDVRDLLLVPTGIRATGAVEREQPAPDKADDIHDPIPMHGERADAYGNGVDVWGA